MRFQEVEVSRKPSRRFPFWSPLESFESFYLNFSDTFCKLFGALLRLFLVYRETSQRLSGNFVQLSSVFSEFIWKLLGELLNFS